METANKFECCRYLMLAAMEEYRAVEKLSNEGIYRLTACHFFLLDDIRERLERMNGMAGEW